MKTVEKVIASAGKFLVYCVGATVLSPAYASTITVPSGTTITTNNLTETSVTTIKDGAGTLVMTGNGSLKRMQVKAGVLHVSGGTTTISDSTATGTSSGSLVFEQFADATETVVDGGATLTLTDGQYVMVKGGALVVSNATVDATGITGHFMNAHGGLGANGSKIVIGDGGVFKTKFLRPAGGSATDVSKKDLVGIELNEGGTLRVSQFWADDNSRYGCIWFNGGTLRPQPMDEKESNGVQKYLFNLGETRTTWQKSQVTPTVMAGGVHIDMSDMAGGKNNVVHPAFKSGVSGGTDGGVHVTGPNLLYWFAKDSDYTGGTWLESTGGILGLNPKYGDSVFGKLPDVPSTNIWITGSNPTIYNQENEFVIHPNRTVFVKNGSFLRTGAGANARLVFGGLVKGEAVGGLEYPTNTVFHVRGDWAGTTVLSPGAGRTNDVGCLTIEASLEITNGVTRVASSITATTATHKAPLYISAGGSATALSETKGRLIVRDGGVLYAPQTGVRYAVMANYAQADICGGTVEMPNIEWLNALNRPSLTTVRDGGFLNVGIFRVTQGVTSGDTVVRLGTNGILRASQLALDLTKDQPNVTFLFDGGVIQSASGYAAPDEKTSGTDRRQSFIRDSSNAKWAGVKFAIGPGGAVFDTDNDKHLYWHRPLVKAVAGESDGGITVRGNKDKSVIFYKDLEYNGPTTVDGACTLQLRDGSLPTGTKLVLKNGGKAGFSNYDGTHTPTPATLDSIEGDGTLTWCRGITVTNAIAPSIGGTITLHEACTLDGVTLEIAGDATGCGKVIFDAKQDVSGLKLKMKDVDSFKKDAAKNTYKILEAPNGIKGEFDTSELPDGWHVKYAADGVYLRPNRGTIIFVY